MSQNKQFDEDLIDEDLPGAYEERQGEVAYKEEVESINLDCARARLDEWRQLIEHKERFANGVFRFTMAWAIGLGFILFWQGFGSKIGFFELSDAVLVTLIGSTTVNVVWALHIVLRSVFPSRENGGLLDAVKSLFSGSE